METEGDNNLGQMSVNSLHRLMYQYNENNQSLYLSYPTEPFWGNEVRNEELKDSLVTVKKANLYLHFPFCNELCHYCCCEAVRCLNEKEIDRYLLLLEKELRYKFSSGEKVFIENMHWGGGTPSLMNTVQMKELLCILDKYFCRSHEGICSIEVFPDKKFVTREKLEFLHKNGFRYISLGIQDLNKRVLDAIHRKVDFQDVVDIVAWAKQIGLSVSMDICYGLPYQGLTEFEYTIHEVCELQPEKIVIYPYAHFPTVYPLQRNIPSLSIPNNFMRAMMKKLANDRILQEYEMFGCDTFIRKDGREVQAWRNKSLVHGFMGVERDTAKSLIGVGASAISKICDQYIKNQVSLKKYAEMLDRELIPVEKMYKMSEEDKIRYEIIEKNILVHYSIDVEKIEKLYGIHFAQKFCNELEQLTKMQDRGILTGVGTSQILISEFGHYFVKCVARVFDAYNC